MQRRRTYTVIAILLAVLVLGVGYAAVSNVTLNLNGTANINANFDFSVEYDTTHTVGKSTADTTTTTETPPVTHDVVAGAYTSDSVATMTVWLDKDHTSAYAIYKVDNTSSQLSGRLSTTVTAVSGANATYFTEPVAVYYKNASCEAGDELGTDVLPYGESAYLKVTIGLNKAPLVDITGATFNVVTTATPVEE